MAGHNTKAPRDLSRFHAPPDGKIPWDRRAKMVRKMFPSVDTLDWDKLFRVDLGILGDVWQDVMKADMAPAGKPGPRPALDPATAMRRLRRMAGADYSELPFVESVRVLSQGASVRVLAKETGLDRNFIHRLLTHKVEPDVYAMTQVAVVYGKHPSYFMEYRAAYVAAMIHSILMWSPESSINTYRKLRKAEDDSRT